MALPSGLSTLQTSTSEKENRSIPGLLFLGRHETVEDTQLFCQFANEVWEAVREEHHVNLCCKQFTSPRIWVLDLMERCSDIQATMACVSLWGHIWDAHNKAREQAIFMHP
jgi:hypothetical protein